MSEAHTRWFPEDSKWSQCFTVVQHTGRIIAKYPESCTSAFSWPNSCANGCRAAWDNCLLETLRGPDQNIPVEQIAGVMEVIRGASLAAEAPRGSDCCARVCAGERPLLEGGREPAGSAPPPRSPDTQQFPRSQTCARCALRSGLSCRPWLPRARPGKEQRRGGAEQGPCGQGARHGPGPGPARPGGQAPAAGRASVWRSGSGTG